MEPKELKAELDKLQVNLKTYLSNELQNEPWMIENQKAIDECLSKIKQIERSGGITPSKGLSFGTAFSGQIEKAFSSKPEVFKAFENDRNVTLSIDMKSVGTMTTSGNLSGDPQQTYNTRQGLVPAQKINIRDLIPATDSPTGQYVTYRETGGEGSIDDQTEGNTKGQVDYDFTEVKIVNGYVAGFVTFSKQMMNNLPWLQSTLTRALLRDFFKKENAKFYAAIASAATGFNTSAESDDAKAIIDVLMGRADADFNNSFIICKHSQVGRLLKLLYTNGYYMGAGSVVGTPEGIVRIANTPVIGASWATSDKIMVIDSDFIERVERDSLKVEFSYENQANFEKNLVTARVECQENLNLLRLDAHSYMDMGNES